MYTEPALAAEYNRSALRWTWDSAYMYMCEYLRLHQRGPKQIKY